MMDAPARLIGITAVAARTRETKYDRMINEHLDPLYGKEKARAERRGLE